jgi:hypothetical protein
MNDLIVSVHVPKTGGVSFREVLLALAEGRVVWDYDDRPLAPAAPWVRLHRALRRVSLPADTRAVHGHFVASKYRRRYPDASYVTWLRDPVERVASHYHYWRREPDPKNATCRKLLEEDLSLVSFAALPEMREVHRRFLGGVPLEAFAFVGITEHFDEGMARFRRLFCPGVTVEAGRQNANPERKGERYDLDPGIRERIAALNPEDVALYARGRERFAALHRP